VNPGIRHEARSSPLDDGLQEVHHGLERHRAGGLRQRRPVRGPGLLFIAQGGGRSRPYGRLRVPPAGLFLLHLR
jgi:hypothetical protein